MKKYRVNIQMKFSKDIIVTAKNTREAAKIAFGKYKPRAKDFKLYTDEIKE